MQLLEDGHPVVVLNEHLRHMTAHHRQFRAARVRDIGVAQPPVDRLRARLASRHPQHLRVRVDANHGASPDRQKSSQDTCAATQVHDPTGSELVSKRRVEPVVIIAGVQVVVRALEVEGHSTTEPELRERPQPRLTDGAAATRPTPVRPSGPGPSIVSVGGFIVGFVHATARSTRDAVPRAVEPHTPLDRMNDGTWLHAPFGAVLVVAGGQRVVCHACGDALEAITRHHVRRHNLDLAGYRERFGLNKKTSLIAPALAEVRREEGRRRWAENARVRAGLAIGQEMARSGELNDVGVAAQPAGSRRAQGRRPASRDEAAPALREHRGRQSGTARARWEQRAQALGFADLEAYLSDRRSAGVPPNRVRTELGLGGGTAERLLRTAR